MLKPIGVQLYSLRAECEKDYLGVLKRVAEIGYKYVEPAINLGGYSPAEYKKILADLGLGMISSHYPWANVSNVNEMVDLAKELGLDKIVCGYGPNDFVDMDAIKRTAEATTKVAEVAAKNGLTLFCHNHNWEFERLDGKLKYQYFAEMCPAVKFELDCFWSTNFGTENPVEMLKTFADRTILLHMKDGVTHQAAEELKITNGTYDRKVDLLPLGTGSLPIKDIVAAAPASVEAVIVELDYCSIDMFTAIEQSYKFMVENGIVAGNK
ncbi:MAG: sugar phosphate isomerase/epimerase [Lentisphaeria bacterium]|nr:sugar phosphate isomerase/epimerase [Lentisphaeria bacterium]